MHSHVQLLLRIREFLSSRGCFRNTGTFSVQIFWWENGNLDNQSEKDLDTHFNQCKNNSATNNSKGIFKRRSYLTNWQINRDWMPVFVRFWWYTIWSGDSNFIPKSKIESSSVIIFTCICSNTSKIHELIAMFICKN